MGVAGEFTKQDSYGGLGLDLTQRVRAGGVRGSALPRTLLAYQFAILRLLETFSPMVMCPLIIDSPRQQDPDPERLRAILQFVRDRRPKGQQLVLAFVNGADVRFSGIVHEVNGFHHVLREEEYSDIARETRVLIDQLPVNRLLW